ncbi:MAG: hypothetical protein A2Y97_12005 [Nitrospirae bacterium RBG_13_39_12]|nr:MAG: hypothetical protein A2Y97_12005 [Nitrospirae bacterium RBG_13_39_12]
MKTLDPSEVEKRLKAWADITMLSLELKRAAMRKRHPESREDEINELVRKELSILKSEQDER